MRNNIFFILLALIIQYSCINKTNKSNTKPTSEISTDSPNEFVKFDVKYAKGFNIKYVDDYALIDINDPNDKNKLNFHYAIVRKGHKKDNIPSKYTIIETPIKRAICMTTPQLSYFIKLNAINNIIGLTSTQFLKNEEINKNIKLGRIGRIGFEGNFDSELVLSLNPDIILVSPFKRGGYEEIKNLNFPMLSFLAYEETTPLGQSEWLKVISMLICKEKTGLKIFNDIEEKYNNLKNSYKDIKERPTVMMGELRGSNWYVVGGKNYLSQQIEDAGATYFLKDNPEAGGINLAFESVYSKGSKVDFWRMLNSKTDNFTYDYIKSMDHRYSDFKAFKEKKIFYCDMKTTPFYENAPVEPEVVLADLIKIFHPSLLPNHKPIYFKLLKK